LRHGAISGPDWRSQQDPDPGRPKRRPVLKKYLQPETRPPITRSHVRASQKRNAKKAESNEELEKKFLTKSGSIGNVLARSTTESRRLFENQVEMEVRARSRI
jgi:hypothetical protein